MITVKTKSHHLIQRAMRNQTLKWILIHNASLFYRAQGKLNAHFLHVSKTGGTAIKEALSNITTTPKYKIWLHRHHIKLSDIPKGDKVFLFIRDPIDRFISGFYSRKREGKPGHYRPWNSVEKLAFQRFRTPNELAKSLSSPDEEIRNSAFQAMHGIGHVKTFIKDWVGSEEYLLSRKEDFLFIGCQEYLNRDFETLKELLEIPPEMAKLPEDPTRAHKSPTNVDKHLDPEAVKNLLEWYEEDYEVYRTLLMLRMKILRRLGKELLTCEKWKYWKKIARKPK
ncbi:sulfotransferase family protein [Thermococcus argininiproducens]|uniref:Sulfotransferase family protein n=1 Tax=Thermococcus argininiproducens TaxID=2866384 RepID=A0A9E7SDW4_9EURY|nr:sulfotransferase family 2 domain-containing protein [Thermococcus argininiproducens]USH00418.1 sulfotransferase family protein [Thermococcus argininiproducens]